MLENLGSAVSFPSGVRGGPKTHLVHSKAVRKQLVAIVFNILSTMFYSRTIKNLALANMTVSDGVESVAQGGGRGGSAPLKIRH